MTDANAELMTEFGEPVTYTPDGGQGQSIIASVGPVEGEIQDDELGETKVKNRQITVALTEIAGPAINDIITVGSLDWLVTGLVSISSGVAVLDCRWNKEQSRHHEMHKRKIE